MESITKQLVNIGHGMSREIAADEPAVAKLLVELSSALDVQYERGNALEAKCAALAAENAGLKSSVAEVRRQAFNARRNSHNCGPFQYSDLCDSIIDETKVETPSTDAFFAEVRASAFNDLCAEFVKHKALAGLGDRQKVTVFEATEALLHCAEQLDTQFRKGVQS